MQYHKLIYSFNFNSDRKTVITQFYQKLQIILDIMETAS